MPRYFVTSSAQFGFSSPVGVQAAKVDAYIYVDGVMKAAVQLGAGISENESPPGTFTYHIVDKELSFGATPSPGVVQVRWYAQNASNVNADTYPTLTAPTLDVVADPTALNVTSSTPTNNATGISTRNAIVVVFDDDLDTTNFEPDRITLRMAGSSHSVPTTVYIDPDDNTRLIVKPTSDMAETTLYELLIKNVAIYSTGGNRMGADYKLRFTTGADDFTSVTEATTEGVIERAAPIILNTGGVIPPTAPAATLTGSNPPVGSYNQTATSITLTFDDNLDAAEVPTFDLTITPLFGLNELYYVNNSLWGQESEPTLPTVSGYTYNANTITIDLTAAPPGNAEVTLVVSGLENASDEDIDPVTITYSTTLFPYWVGVPEVRNKAGSYISSDVTDAVIAEVIANIGVNMYYIYGTAVKHLQRCVILHEAVLQLMDDYFATKGGPFGEQKTLGAFSVSRRPGDLDGGTYGRIKDQLEKCYQNLNSYFLAGVGAVKSSDSILERPDYRIRTWREAHPANEHAENEIGSRYDKLPNDREEWS